MAIAAGRSASACCPLVQTIDAIVIFTICTHAIGCDATWLTGVSKPNTPTGLRVRRDRSCIVISALIAQATVTMAIRVREPRCRRQKITATIAIGQTYSFVAMASDQRRASTAMRHPRGADALTAIAA